MFSSINLLTAALLACSTLVSARPALQAPVCQTVQVTSTITISASATPAIASLATVTSTSVQTGAALSSVFEIPYVTNLPHFFTSEKVVDCMFSAGQCTTTMTSMGYLTIKGTKTMTRHYNDETTVTYTTVVPTSTAAANPTPVISTTVIAQTICPSA